MGAAISCPCSICKEVVGICATNTNAAKFRVPAHCRANKHPSVATVVVILSTWTGTELIAVTLDLSMTSELRGILPTTKFVTTTIAATFQARGQVVARATPVILVSQTMAVVRSTTLTGRRCPVIPVMHCLTSDLTATAATTK